MAVKVWSSSPISRDRLFGNRPFAGLHPASGEQFLDLAVAQGWVTVDGDELARGALDPRPAPTTRIPN